MASGLESDFVTLHEIVKAAKIRLNPNIWDYLIGGTETETTLRRNRLALDTIAFKPRVLRDVSKIDPSSEILGQKIRLPVMLAPVGSLESFEAGGGITVAQGAGASNVAMLISSVTTLKLQDIVKGGAGPKIYQLYVRGDDAWVADRVKEAMDAGYDAFCITVDTQVYSRRERDIAKRFVKSWRAVATGQDHQAAFSWRNFIAVREKFPDVKFMLKGIGTGEDAELACQNGVWAVYCSNHGGRQLDHGRGSAEVLPEIVEAVAGRAKVAVDGSFSRGSDIVKAICMGADWVGLGRLYCYGLAAAGAAGIERVIELLEEEMKEVMGLLGVTSLAQLDKSYIAKSMPTNLTGVHSAFPLLNLQDEGY
ncbi:MAG: putative FMN-dependent alpha-hydroxy acid dehydrogenase family protein [Rhodospirillaceae bacterium]|nr:MAG: putative FMN-dependent alpha-hydroxy acid dehydrogenase family protein [Rhodospirillaceae bacterium]